MKTQHMLAAAFLALLAQATTEAATDRYRLTWRENPATSMVIGWRQNGGTAPTVHYGTTDHGTNYAAYPNSAAPARTASAMGMTHNFARLTGLLPDTAYYFVVRDSDGTSARMWFRTAPSTPETITYIVGGDSRNNRTPRQQANRMVAKLRPLFVLFGGDFTDGNTSSEWVDWFNDWQQTKAADGRMFPIVIARGNHDDNTSLYNMFDTPNSNIYFALGLGGGFMRLYTLNSEITTSGAQTTWLTNDLSANASTKWKIAHYHKPMFPHNSGKSEDWTQYDYWAQPFHTYRMSLVVECDSHCVKTTWPVKPGTGTTVDNAFVRDDATGTVYTGEGCWGAPLRTGSDVKPWTRDSGSFNMIQWVHAYTDRMELRTVGVANVDSISSVSDSAPTVVPAGLDIWKPANNSTGVITMYPAGAANQPPSVSITSPANNSTYSAPATITFNATASDADGSVTKVEFWNGNTLLGTDTTSPYSYTGTFNAGSHAIDAVAFDNSGAAASSNVVNITVSGTGSSITVSLQDGANGYTGTTDTKIKSDATSTNYGTSTTLETDGSPDYGVLIRWDLSAIPAGKTVTAVSLTFNVTNVSSQSYELYEMKRSWSESSATWIRANSSTNWTTAGANSSTDRGTSVLGSMSSSSTGIKTYSLNANGIAVVQNWINNPGSNNGFILQDYANNSDGLDLSSSETSTVANRPKITITYQ